MTNKRPSCPVCHGPMKKNGTTTKRNNPVEVQKPTLQRLHHQHTPRYRQQTLLHTVHYVDLLHLVFRGLRRHPPSPSRHTCQELPGILVDPTCLLDRSAPHLRADLHRRHLLRKRQKQILPTYRLRRHARHLLALVQKRIHRQLPHTARKNPPPTRSRHP